MKKLLLVIGIILLAVGVISLLLAVWHWYSYYHVMDGSAALFARLQRRAITFAIIGGGSVILGIIGLIIRAKL